MGKEKVVAYISTIKESSIEIHNQYAKKWGLPTIEVCTKCKNRFLKAKEQKDYICNLCKRVQK